jgi:hypothetical protein
MQCKFHIGAADSFGMSHEFAAQGARGLERDFSPDGETCEAASLALAGRCMKVSWQIPETPCIR